MVHSAGESAASVARAQRDRARRLLESAERWERGAEGERRTADVLARLPQAWVTRHDLPWPGRQLANVDHVCVGPTGIFVIDTKNWSGSARLDRGVLRVAGRRRAAQVDGVRAMAAAVASVVPPAQRFAVRGVLCLVGEAQVERPELVGDVVVCTADQLLQVVATGSPVVHPHRIAEVVRALDRPPTPVPHEPPAPPVAPRPVPSSAGAPHRAPRGRRRGGRSMPGDLVRLGAAIAAAAALLAQPQVVRDAADAKSGLVASVLLPQPSSDPAPVRAPRERDRRERERPDRERPDRGQNR